MLPTNRRPTHPGKVLREEFLRPGKITQTTLARKIGFTPQRVNEIVNGKRGISALTALKLANALGTSPEFWMLLQNAIELYDAQQDLAERGRL